MGVWRYYNPNPLANRTEDCTVRALAKALNISWDEAHFLLSTASRDMGLVMHHNDAMSGVLRQNGFYRAVIPNTCPDCYTAKDFCKDNPRGTFVLGFVGHVATVKNGRLYDTWDSSECVPVYFWYRR